MVNKIKTRGIKRQRYSKRKKFSKYRKHYTRKFGKRFQRRIKRRRQTRNKRGGTFNLSLKNESNLNSLVDYVLYKGFALVKKTSNWVSRKSRRQVIICKLKGPKWVILKCRDDEHCTDNVVKSEWSRPYKIYDMNNLKEIHDKNGQTTYNFEYKTDERGEHVYRIHLTEGADEFNIIQGVTNLRNAIMEQQKLKNLGYATTEQEESESVRYIVT